VRDVESQEEYDAYEDEVFVHTAGQKQKENPGKPMGLIALANVIPDMGAISSVNLLQNKIGIDQAKALASLLQEHPTLKSLCGNKGYETKLDMSGKMNGAEDAIMLAPEIIDNGAMLKLTFGAKQVVTMTTDMTEANFSGKLESHEARIVAAFLPKCTYVPDICILILADMSSPAIGRCCRWISAATAFA
jgi:hypothetical protein